jgi:hypothetical protein
VARGFDSKSVTDQQDEAERSRERNPTKDGSVSPRLKSLALARIDLIRRIEAAPESRRRELRESLAALDELIGKT